MKCKTCGYDNLLKANYCRNCGSAFTAEEKDAAKKAGLGSKMEKADEVVQKIITVKDILTLSFLTDNVIVRTLLILIPLAIAAVTGQMSPGGLTLLESEDYVIHCNTETREYYVDTDAQVVSLKLFVPKNTETVFPSQDALVEFARASGLVLKERVIGNVRNSYDRTGLRRMDLDRL